MTVYHYTQPAHCVQGQGAAMPIILRNSTHFTCFDHRLFFIFPHLCLIMLKGQIKIPPYRPCPARENIGQYRIILSADTASEVRQMLTKSADNTGSFAGWSASGGTANRSRGSGRRVRGAFAPKRCGYTATRHYRAFWQRRCRAAAAGAVLKPSGGNCAVLP